MSNYHDDDEGSPTLTGRRSRAGIIESADAASRWGEGGQALRGERAGVMSGEQARPRRGGRVVALAVALIALAGFGGIVWYAYNWGIGAVDTAEVPFIAAEQTPEKTRPADPGGLDVRYRDSLVMNDLERPAEATRVERLLPPPEEPQPPEPEPEPSAVAALGQPLPALEPASSELETVEEELAASTESGSSEAATPEEPVVEETLVAAESEAGEAESGTQVAVIPQPKPEAAPAPPAPSQQAAAAAGGFRVQLAAVSDPAAARTEWSRLQGRFPDALGSLSLQVEPVEVEGKGKLYRIQAGPLPSREKADSLCSELKGQGQPCIVRQAG